MRVEIQAGGSSGSRSSVLRRPGGAALAGTLKRAGEGAGAGENSRRLLGNKRLLLILSSRLKRSPYFHTVSADPSDDDAGTQETQNRFLRTSAATSKKGLQKAAHALRNKDVRAKLGPKCLPTSARSPTSFCCTLLRGCLQALRSCHAAVATSQRRRARGGGKQGRATEDDGAKRRR